jgi:hypothetical protein
MGYDTNGRDRGQFLGIIGPYSWIERGKEKIVRTAGLSAEI